MKLPPVDYHIHTVYSGHSVPEMTVRGIIKRAEVLNLKSIAITEHAFSSQMGKANLGQITEEVKAIETKVNVFVGMEIDPDYSRKGKLIFEEFDKKDLCPVLVATHAYPGLGRGWHEKLNLTRPQKRKLYSAWFRLMERILENPLVDVLAHPGRLIAQNDIIEEFGGHVLRDFENLFDGAKENRVAIELNETFLGNFRTEKLQKSYPDVIRLALSKDLKFSLGSDAHRIEDIGRRERICSLQFRGHNNNFLSLNKLSQFC
jgi:HisJ family histidinol phosphate phosphatase